MATPAPHLFDEILEEIFLRLPTPAALARVSTACSRFHGIITEPPFLRRFRKRHPPPLLGFAYRSEFLPVQAPHPSAPLARAFADVANFTYSFLPECSEGYWVPCDARDGRVLLEGTRAHGRSRASITSLAVCDPLSRRYVMLPLIHEEMTARLTNFGPKLAPIGEDEDETSFKVVCTARHESKLIVFVFSSVSGKWCIAASTSWSSLGAAVPSWDDCSRSNYVHGCCLYWTNLWRDKLLVLDMGSSMEFSTIHTGHIMQLIDLPDQIWCAAAIVDGTKGALEMFTLVRDNTPAAPSFRVCHTIQQNNGKSSDEWKLKSIIALPLGSIYFTVDANEGFLFLQSIRQTEPDEFEEDLFSVEVKTSELKKLRGPTSLFRPAARIQSYFGFPLSKPSL